MFTAAKLWYRLAMFGHWSSRRLNLLSERLESAERSRYLEIGVRKGHTFRQVNVPEKWGVDPNPLISAKNLPPRSRMIKDTSDAFFESVANQMTFDLVFLDGLHEARQTWRDLNNALLRLSENGIILVDDVVPDDDSSAHPDQKASLRLQYKHGKFDRRWQGDVWKIIPVIAELLPELKVHIVGRSGSLRDNAQAVIVPTKRFSNRPKENAVIAEFEKLKNASFTRFKTSNPKLFASVDETQLLNPAKFNLFEGR